MISNFEKAVAELVIKKQRERGMTQSQLDSLMGFEGSFIGQLLSMKKAFNLDHLNQLAKIFECSPKDFIPANYIEGK